MSNYNTTATTYARALLNAMSMLASKKVVIPKQFQEQVAAVKSSLICDTSGLINSILDYGMDAGQVQFTIDTSNSNLTRILNNWLSTVNIKWMGKVPVGIKALSKEYYRERWKASSMPILETRWESVDGMYLPTSMFFLNSENIYIDKERSDYSVGDYVYKLKTSDGFKELVNTESTKYFMQKPFSSWGDIYPVPFLIQRGVYKNGIILDQVVGKGESLINEAMEYLLLMKKGTEELAKLGQDEFIYSKDDMTQISKEFDETRRAKASTNGTTTYVTGFDTEIEHLIPEYNKALSGELTSPLEQRILAGLGFIEIYNTSNRKETVLNPKPFQEEVKNAVADFQTLLSDILTTVLINNKNRRKYVNTKDIQVKTSPVYDFIDKDFKNMLTSMYNRGCLSKQTYIEIVGELDFKTEVKRRTKEDKDKINEILFPPIIQNNGQLETPNEEVEDEEVTPDKTGPESIDYIQ